MTKDKSEISGWIGDVGSSSALRLQVGIKDPLVGIVLVGDDGRCSTILGMSCKLGEEIRVVIKIITTSN
jgi:hypothetical protein